VDRSLLNEKERSAYDAFLANSTDQTISFSTGEVKRRMTMAERLADYRAKLADLRDRSSRKLWRFGRDVEGARLRAAKQEVTKLRTGLLEDLDAFQTAALIHQLNVRVLGVAAETFETLPRIRTDAEMAELSKGPLSNVPTTPIDLRPVTAQLKLLEEVLRRASAAEKADAKLAKEYEAAADAVSEATKGLPDVPALPPLPPDERLAWMDWLTRWGLTVIGACLLAGFLTRLNCWLGALFLLMTYLAVPPFPWLPAVGPQEGNYLFVNKNVVEMFALCVLGTLPTGRWFGADGLIQSLWRGITGTTEEEATK
jgi:uncharacterized membrane protein YphA (DoxX/SURF4 family)